MRRLARRKHDQTSAALQDLDRAPQTAQMSRCGWSGAHRIHRDEQMLNCRDRGKNVVCEESVVGPDAPDYCRQNCAFQNSERMTRDDHDGPTLLNLLNIAFA